MHEFRTHTCGELREPDLGKQVKISGWVFRKRDFGKLLFVDLRDHYGITQVVFEGNQEIAKIRSESVICVEGQVVKRSDETINPNLPTGHVEVVSEKVTVLSSSEILPFSIDDIGSTGEDLRLKYRFLDLRREVMHNNILLRSQVIRKIREKMHDLGFNEIQTPILTCSSPEGARDYVVPSRLYPGKFYALPQAPQIFKQLLMTSGIDRYFQIAPCFRDEDARADRSPGEFYQLDMEMAFATQEDVFQVNEALMIELFSEFSKWEVPKDAFPRIPYDEALLKYGSDKPDLRNPLEIFDASEVFKDSGFKAFAGAISNGAVVRAMTVKDVASKPRSFYDKLVDHATSIGAKGLAYLVFQEDKVKGPVAKFLDEDLIGQLKTLGQVAAGDAVFFICDQKSVAQSIAGQLRTKLGQDLDLIEKNVFRFCWIVDFPMYERDEDTGKVVFSHNPFSMPQGGIEALDTQDPLDIKAYQYDIVCNGVELSSGAVRNHTVEGMKKAFAVAGYAPEVVETEFSGMVRAFTYGAPPHAGIAPGVDRMVMLLADVSNIREIIPFPMNQKAQDIMMGAPSELSPERYRELHIKLDAPKGK